MYNTHNMHIWLHVSVLQIPSKVRNKTLNITLWLYQFAQKVCHFACVPRSFSSLFFLWAGCFSCLALWVNYIVHQSWLQIILYNNILSVSEKLPVSKFWYFEKYIIQLYGYFYVQVSGQRQTGLERSNSSTSPGTMVHVKHELFMFFAVFKNSKSSFSEDNMPVHAPDVFIVNAFKMIWIVPLNTKYEDQTLRKHQNFACSYTIKWKLLRPSRIGYNAFWCDGYRCP